MQHDRQKAHDRIRNFYDWSDIAEMVELVYDSMLQTTPYDLWTRLQW